MRHCLSTLALASFVSFASMAASAAPVPVSVAPVNVALAQGANSASIEVGNRGIESTGIEIRIVRLVWKDGAEQHEPTTDFLLTPPSFRLDPGMRRIVRFQFAGKRGDAEGTYRMMVRQLPELGKADGAIHMSVTQGIPIFVAPTAAQPALSLVSDGDKTLLLNSGNVTVHVDSLDGPDCRNAPTKVGARLFPNQAVALASQPGACTSRAATKTGSIPVAAVK